MDNKISREFHFGSLLRFSLPTIAMMLMMSLYSMVDGIFVSQFVGTNAFSSINIIIPVTFAVLGVGIMLGTGGSAVIARKLGEKKEKEARQDFSLLMLFGVVLSVVLALLGLLFRDPLIRILGANDTLMADCRVYFTILAAGFPAYMPVSYTHLDVYKRQAETVAVLESARTAVGGSGSCRTCLLYTSRCV